MINQEIKRVEREIRQLRYNDNGVLSNNEKEADIASKALDKALLKLKQLKSQIPKTVGQYSGLTRSELNQAGLCETDFY